MVHVPPHVASQQRAPALEVRPFGRASSNRLRLGTRLLLVALRAASAATGVLPRHPLGERACALGGAAWYLSAPGARAAVHDNLRHILGRQPTRAEVVRVFHHGALNYWDTFAIPHFTPTQILRLVDLRGAEHLEHARAAGRGVICVTAHLGSVAFVGQVLPALGFPVTSVLEPLEPPELYAFFARRRQALGARMLPLGASAARQLLLALRRNEVIGLVSDRDVTGTGPIIPFLGAPTRFPDGAASLSVRTGAPILVAVAIRKAAGRFDGWIEPLPPVSRTGDAREDVLRLTRAVAERLGYYVANHPEQWTVFQRRWPEA